MASNPPNLPIQPSANHARPSDARPNAEIDQVATSSQIPVSLKVPASGSLKVPASLTVVPQKLVTQKIVRFDDLSSCGNEVWIEHLGKLYRLQATRQGKLLLTK